MTTKNKIFTALGILAALAGLGVAVPTLLSAKSDVAVWGATAALVILAVWGISWILERYGNVDPEVRKHSEDETAAHKATKEHNCGCGHAHKAVALAFILASSFSMSACGMTKVPAGHAGVKVYLLGSEKGVDNEVLGAGRYFTSINEEIYLFPIFNVNYTWTASTGEGNPIDESIGFGDKDGLAISGDFGIEYAVDATMVGILFQTYRQGIGEITDIVLRNKVRDAIVKRAATLSAEELYSTKNAWLIETVEEDVRQDVKSIGIKIVNLYMIGKFRLPPEVTQSITDKIKANQSAQKVQNQVLEAQAEADKAIATARGKAESMLLVAKAEAEANQLKQRTLTRELIDYEMIQKWNGQLPTVTGGATPFINLSK